MEGQDVEINVKNRRGVTLPCSLQHWFFCSNKALYHCCPQEGTEILNICYFYTFKTFEDF
jgi:hypothetical protein